MASISSNTTATGDVHFLNLEYFFRVIYDTIFSGSGLQFAAFITLLAAFWNFLTIVALLAAIYFLVSIMYAQTRLRQIDDREHHKYTTIDTEAAEDAVEHSRWAHVMTLIEGTQESDWRQAIIEADIMLDDVLGEKYPGATVSDKLKVARFETIEDAWEAHKVRNEIAHQGSAYRLDDRLAYRTIQRFERVFKELGAI